MASSRSPSAARASPPLRSARRLRASSSIVGPWAAGASARAAALRNPSDLMAMFSFKQVRSRICMMASLDKGLTITTRERDRSGEMTSKEGFSVVAPMRVIRPDSTWGRKASCWALLKR